VRYYQNTKLRESCRCGARRSAAVFIKALLVAVATALCRRFYNKAIQRVDRATLLHFQLCRRFHKGIIGRCSNGALPPFSLTKPSNASTERRCYISSSSALN
jgi:hypothetical protein